MKFGVCLPNYGNNLSKRALVDSALLAENLGFHSIWTTDHLLVPKKHSEPYGNILDSLTTLAYVGAITHRIQLGTSVLVLPLRNPIVVAKQIATIDYLTNGRLILGTAVGWNEEEFQNLSVPFRNRGRRFEEAIKLLRTLYQSESPQFQGQFHKFTDATFKPKPRKNGPTIWFGGNSDVAIQRASKLADGWQPVGLAIDAYRASVEKIKANLPTGKTFTFSLRIHVDLDGKTEAYAASSGEPRSVISGNKKQAVEAITQYQTVGLQHMVCYFGDIGLAKLKKQMTQFAKAIIPAFKK